MPPEIPTAAARRRLPRALPVLFALAAAIPAAALAAETVTLPVEPPSRRTAALEEVWRLGGYDEEAPLLGLVSGAALDGDGNLYVVDNQLAQVLVLGPDGGLVTTLGREGDGPGELRNPHSVFLCERGVGVVMGFPGKVVYLAHDGTPAGEAVLGGDAAEGGFRFVRGGLTCVDGRLVGASGRGSFDMEAGISSTVSCLGIMDLDGAFLARFAEHTDEQDLQAFAFDERKNWAEHAAWCALPTGYVCSAAARDRWAVNVRDLEGNLVRVYERPGFAARERTAADKAEVGGGMRIVINDRRVEPDITALDTDPAVMGMQGAPDGRLFVRSCWDVRDRLEAGTAGRWDVISPDGELVEQLTVTFPEFDPAQDALLWLDGTRFLVVRNYESAQAAMGAGMADEDEQAEAALLDAEPLELVLVRLAG